jgi:cathepsin A (carboxypeptidase C)
LIYAGDADFICNWLGNQAWTEALEWPGQKDFNKADIKDIKLDNGDKYGKIKSSGNFTFLQVFGAGHMVPSECSFFNLPLQFTISYEPNLLHISFSSPDVQC